MKENKKVTITTILLVVGVLFILISGGIFVTTTWKYLPEFVKQLALLGASIGFFAGAHRMKQNDKLRKVSGVIYYLGVAFAGFFGMAIMGGMSYADARSDACEFMTASLLMMIPVAIKWHTDKKGFEFVVFTVLTNSCVIAMCVTCKLDSYVYFALFSCIVIGLSLLDYKKQMEENASYKKCVTIVYMIHAVCLTAITGFFALFLYSEWVAGILALSASAISAISWKARKEKAIRVYNSVAVMVLVYVVTAYLFEKMGLGNEFGFMLLVALAVNAVIMLWMGRKEMVWMQVMIAMAISYMQLFCYWTDSWSLFRGFDAEWSTTYYPYSILYAGVFFCYVLKNGAGIMNWKQSGMLKLSIMQLVTGMIMWMTSKDAEMITMTGYLLGMTTALTFAGFASNQTAKRIFKMFGLVLWVIATMCQPFLEIPVDFRVEWNCFLIAMGIVLFRFIWYDDREQLSGLYFALTCIMLGILLLHNLAVEGIGNVLILGMVGIVMLVANAIMNNRKYVIVSSITLIILVFYLTKEFWLSIAWWVYLFVAGVVLVALAVKKEKEA